MEVLLCRFFPILVILVVQCTLFRLHPSLANVIDSWQQRGDKEEKKIKAAVGLEKPFPHLIRVETGEDEGQAEGDQESSDEVSLPLRGSQTVPFNQSVFATFVQ